MLKSKKDAASPIGSTLAKRPSGALEVGTPFYQDGQLQVRVYWKKRGGMRPDLKLCLSRISTSLRSSISVTHVPPFPEQWQIPLMHAASHGCNKAPRAG